MPMYPCHRLTEGGGGEALVETLLWTNPSPTSNFGTQIITLSDSISNYDYIKVQFLGSTTISISSSVVTPVQDFILQQRSTNNTLRSITPGLQMSDGLFIRAFDYVSDTSINITDALRLNGSANNNSITIPYKIYGVKKSSSGGGNFDITNPDLDTGDVSIGANGTGTFVSTKRIRQAVVLHLNTASNRGNWVFFVNCDERVCIFDQAGNMAPSDYSAWVISQTDTSLVWKNNSSVGRSYRLLGWY